MEIKNIKITIYNFKDPMIDIESDDLEFLYSSPFITHHGLQASFESDSPKYNELLEQCSIIQKAVRQINKLHEK